MPRTIDADLQAALSSGAVTPYLRAVFWQGGTPFEYEIKGYKLTGTTLEVSPVNHIASGYPAYLQLKRGAVLAGTPTYITTGKFYISGEEVEQYQASQRKIVTRASLFPETRVSVAGDASYLTVITDFCSEFGKTAVFDDPLAAYWSYQFLPAGKVVNLNNAMQFLNLLRQKYFIFAADLGDEEVLFYHGMADRDADYQYTLRYAPPGAAGDVITNNLFIRTLQPLDGRTYMARDENMTVRTGGTAGKPLHNLGFLESTDDFPEKSTQPPLIKAVMGIDLRPQSGDIVRLDPSYFSAYAYPVEVTEELDLGKKSLNWSTTIETRQVFSNTAGGALPSTIERVASYTPLITTGFDGVLDENDNNLQAAMETLDDHDHGLPALAAGTYQPTLYNTTNVAASARNGDFMYLRVGNIVTVSGSVQIDPTAAGNTELGISLPVASAFTDSYDLSGNGTNPGTPSQLMSIIADSTNDRALCVFTAASAANAFWRVVFQYRIK